MLEEPETRLVLNLLKGDNLPLPVTGLLFSDEFSTFNEQSEDVLDSTFLGIFLLEAVEAAAGGGGGVTKMAVGLTQVPFPVVLLLFTGN